MTPPLSPDGQDTNEFAARIIGALGQMMVDFHTRDVAVQNAVSDMTQASGSLGLNMTDLQHIDLVTQTHADLAKFLPRLAESIRNREIAEQSLAGSLTLRSLQDTLLRPIRPPGPEVDPPEEGQDPGDMHLF